MLKSFTIRSVKSVEILHTKKIQVRNNNMGNRRFFPPKDPNEIGNKNEEILASKGNERLEEKEKRRDLPLASFPNSSSPTCISRTRDTNPSISFDSRSTWLALSICARPRWCCRSKGANHRANNRIFRHLARSRQRSPDPSRTSRWTCPPRHRTCTLSDTCLSPCCSGTTWLPDSPALPASSRSNRDAPTGPRWLPASVYPRYCRKRLPCCLTRLEEVCENERKFAVILARCFSLP